MDNFESYRNDRPRVLVVDDEPIIREVLSDFLSSQGYFVSTAENGAVALQFLKMNRYHLLMTDLKMPVMGGTELLAEIVKRKIKITTIIMTAYATVETAIQTMKNGAYDYIMKPFKIDEITLVIQRALEKERLERENMQLKEANRFLEISEAMNSTLSLDEVLSIIVQSAKQEVEASVASLVLWNKDENRWGSVICDTDILSISPGDLDVFIDLDKLMQAHKLGHPVLYPPIDIKSYQKYDLLEGEKLNSFMSVPLMIRGEVTGMLNVFSFSPGFAFVEGQRKSLYVLASRAANAVDNARLHEELKSMFLQTIEGLAFALDAKDPYTLGHSRRVTLYCERIAETLRLDKKEMEKIRHAATLHDIGKIGLKLESLNKPDALTPEEKDIFCTHPKKGCKILAPIHFFEDLIPIIYHHHEHYDGNGYPEGKSRTQIPLGARILAVADAFDAMTSDRPYRKAMTEEMAAEELRCYAGRQFDPEVVDAFIQFLNIQSSNGKSGRIC